MPIQEQFFVLTLIRNTMINIKFHPSPSEYDMVYVQTWNSLPNKSIVRCKAPPGKGAALNRARQNQLPTTIVTPSHHCLTSQTQMIGRGETIPDDMQQIAQMSAFMLLETIEMWWSIPVGFLRG